MCKLLLLLHFLLAGVFNIALVFFLRPASCFCFPDHLPIVFFQSVQFFFIFLSADVKRCRLVFAKDISDQPRLITLVVRLFFCVVFLYFCLYTSKRLAQLKHRRTHHICLFILCRGASLQAFQIFTCLIRLFFFLRLCRFIMQPQRIAKPAALCAKILLLLPQYRKLLFILRTFCRLPVQLKLLPGKLEKVQHMLCLHILLFLFLPFQLDHLAFRPAMPLLVHRFIDRF